MFKLQDDENLNFKVSILGQKFEDAPMIFDEAKKRLGPKIVHFGPLENRADYFEVLRSADVVVSTAFHEFFGVALIEAAAAGCLPLVPNRLFENVELLGKFHKIIEMTYILLAYRSNKNVFSC